MRITKLNSESKHFGIMEEKMYSEQVHINKISRLPTVQTAMDKIKETKIVRKKCQFFFFFIIISNLNITRYDYSQWALADYLGVGLDNSEAEIQLQN